MDGRHGSMLRYGRGRTTASPPPETGVPQAARTARRTPPRRHPPLPHPSIDRSSAEVPAGTPARAPAPFTHRQHIAGQAVYTPSTTARDVAGHRRRAQGRARPRRRRTSARAAQSCRRGVPRGTYAAEGLPRPRGEGSEGCSKPFPHKFRNRFPTSFETVFPAACATPGPLSAPSPGRRSTPCAPAPGLST